MWSMINYILKVWTCARLFETRNRECLVKIYLCRWVKIILVFWLDYAGCWWTIIMFKAWTKISSQLIFDIFFNSCIRANSSKEKVFIKTFNLSMSARSNSHAMEQQSNKSCFLRCPLNFESGIFLLIEGCYSAIAIFW